VPFKLSCPMYITLEHRSCVIACMHVFYSNKLWNSGPSKDLLTLPKQSDVVSLLSPAILTQLPCNLGAEGNTSTYI
jgi:hypothetical protein